ncbi:FHA domain-containing protein [Microbacterium esteraromaticum]|uniref:FHA domain-containing protein n=1 Tax=Microbacterium esteraromaticum TaxID=57043 RepID=UPI00236840B4|nr:FHA domain-containing protein [Microbacterium esteraromaticum]WDH78412.1 FHA domain-containing protein [Microbacterium esteraromaticum]
MDERQPGYHPTTTHAAWGAGRPHLRITGADDERSTFDITVDQVTIGSGAGSTLLLPGADALHATIVHDDRDEYVLTMHGAGAMNANREEDAEPHSEILRTGAHFTIGEWLLVFAREEFADHGRPFGGREGGELSDQDSQPARPDYRGDDERPRGHEVRDG